MRNVEVIPYENHWCEKFQAEAQLLKTAVPEPVKIHHIGSTSVPGLAAKPIIDMIMEVDDIHKMDEWEALLARIGYEGRGENGISGRRFFIKGSNEQRTHHLHVFEKGDPQIARHLAFRDYMMEHCEEAKAYAALKKDLAERFTYDIEQYMLGKAAFIKEIDQKAGKWIREHKMEH
ncbi:MAG: GrpB family protein [Ectobacillus sp.]